MKNHNVKTYHFQITLVGEGKDGAEAWGDICSDMNNIFGEFDKDDVVKCIDSDGTETKY